MSQLTKGMYGSCSGTHWQSVHGPSKKFGLSYGQLRGGSAKLTHNSGWYNKNGEKLGFGDLSSNDIKRIAREIAPDELFIVLGEKDSYWNFYHNGRINDDEGAPGIDYVAEHARFIIAKSEAFYVNRYQYCEGFTEYCGMRFKNLHPNEVKKFILGKF